MSSPVILTSPALARRHALQRVSMAHAAALASKCCWEKPAPSERRVVVGKLASAASSTETCCQAREPSTRPSRTGLDDIPNPTDVPAPIADTGPLPRAVLGADGLVSRVAAGGSLEELRATGDGGAGCGVDGFRRRTCALRSGRAGAGISRRRQQLDLHGERRGESAHEMTTVLGGHRQGLIAGPPSGRVAPLDVTVDGADPRRDPDEDMIRRGLREGVVAQPRPDDGLEVLHVGTTGPSVVVESSR